jgi:hypothetical protein
MGYAGNGICDPESLQDHSDAYFHIGSLIEIRDYVGDTATGRGGSCGSVTPLTNPSPPNPASATYTIPKGTPFVLSTDNASSAYFAWEEFDLGDPAPPDNENGPNATPRPLFRSRPPSGSTARYFPDFSTLTQATPQPPLGEALPMLNRTMKFRVTARNNHGGFSSNVMAVIVDSAAGPFKILSIGGGNTWRRGSVHVLNWDPAHTDKPPVNCKKVLIQLAIDNDPSKLFTVATDVPNSGSYKLTVPAGVPLTAHAHLILRSTGNIFLAVSPAEIQVTPGP